MKNNKKILAMLVALTMVISMLPMAVFATEAPTLSISSTAGKAGEEATVTVDIANNPGIMAMNFAIEYDTTRLEKVSFTGTDNIGGTWTINNKVLWDDASNNTYIGEILELKFKIKEDAPVGDATITISDFLAGNSSGETINFDIVAGKVTVEAAEICPITFTANGNVLTPVKTGTETCGKFSKSSDIYSLEVPNTAETVNISAGGKTIGIYRSDNGTVSHKTVKKSCTSYDLKTSLIGTVHYNVVCVEDTSTGEVYHFNMSLVTPPHPPHVEETVAGKAATCTETGLTDGKKCSVCGETLVEQEEIPALGHTEEVIPGKAATCTEAGLTEGKKCSVCGETVTAQEVIPALGHKEEVVAGKAATCTEAGLTEGKKCSVCGETVVAQEEIPALGHTDEVIPGKAATCTEPGLTEGKKCTVCGEVLLEQKEIPAIGHTDEDKDFYCDVCKEDLCTEHEEEVIPGKNATCTETGLTDGVKCSVCGEILKEQEEIEALGHKEEVVPGKEATCTEAGLTEGTHCDVCGEVLVAQTEVPATGHALNEEWVSDEENHWHECTVCGEKLDKAAHTGGTATETDKAVCEGCGEEYGDFAEPETPDEPEVPDTPEKPEGNKNWWNGIKNFFDKIFGNHGGDDDSDDSTQQPETPDEPTTPEEPDTPEEPEVPDTPEKPNYGFGWIGDIIGNWFGKWWK